MRKVIRILLPILLAVSALSMLGVGQVLAQSNIDSTNKYAWSSNAGWINFNPADGGVTVYDDHLEGYAWGENIGWIRLGSYDSGGAHTYGNTTNTNYGVNNAGTGNLSGYAWGTSIGWINFNPSDGGVTIDPNTGDFNGYAWSENIGWISFQHASPEYKVNTSWRGGVTVKIYVDLQGSGRPIDGWAVPVNVGFYPANSGTLVMSGSSQYASYYFSGTTTIDVVESVTRAYFMCPVPIASGTYDITIDSDTTLLNVKRSVPIA